MSNGLQQRSKHKKACGSKHSPYLVSHRNALIFRIRIPHDVQACLGRTEYRRSLGRCYAAEAKIRALRLASAAFEVFSLARAVIHSRKNGLQKLSHFSLNTPAKIQFLATIHKPSKIQRNPQTLTYQGLELGCPKEQKNCFREEPNIGLAAPPYAPRVGIKAHLGGKEPNAGIPQTLEYQGLELTPTKERREPFGTKSNIESVFPAVPFASSVPIQPSVSTNHQTSKGKNHMYQDNLGNPDVSAVTTFQGRPLSSLTDDDLRSIADAWLLNALTANNLFILQSEHQQAINSAAASLTMDDGTIITPATITPPTEHLQKEQAEARAETCRSIKEVYQRELRNLQVSQPTASMVDAQLAANGVTVADLETESQAAVAAHPSKASRAYLKACHEFLKARVSFYDVMAQNAVGDYSAHDAAIEKLESAQERRRYKRRAKVDAVTVAATGSSSSSTLSEVIAEMFKEKSQDGSWRPKSAELEKEKLKFFQAVVDPDDSLPMAGLSAKHLSRYKALVLQLPARRGLKPAYRDMELPALIEFMEAGKVPQEDKITPKTIITYYQTAKALLNWAATREYHSNPKIGDLLTIKVDKSPDKDRNPFTDQDIAALFAPLPLLNGTTPRELAREERTGERDSGGRPSRFWVPLLGLFTGARLEELCQLHTDDFILVNRQGDARRVFVSGQKEMATWDKNEETLCLFVNIGKPYQRLKNASSERKIPLSPILVDDLGLLGYAAGVFQQAEQARAVGEPPVEDGRLFPELTIRREADNFGHSVSKWFNSYKLAVGVQQQIGGGPKVFHSFRHTVGRWCDQSAVQEKSAGRYLGHIHDTMTYGRYSTDTAPHLLYEQITVPFTEYVRPFLDIDGLKQSKWAGGGSITPPKPSL